MERHVRKKRCFSKSGKKPTITISTSTGSFVIRIPMVIREKVLLESIFQINLYFNIIYNKFAKL